MIVTGTSPAPEEAKRATSTIPIVMTTHNDPVGSGLVASLARPGANVTGLTQVAPELLGKQLQLLKEVVPGLSRVAVLSNPAIPFQAFELRELELAARSLKVQLEILEVRAPRDLAAAHSTAKKLAGALFSLGGSMFFVHRARIVALAVESRLPALYRSREYPEAGGLMSYGVNLGDNYRRAAAFVDRILRGAKPADLPVEQPTKFELVST